MAPQIITQENLSFNDLLIRPLYSEVRSRDDVSLVTELSGGLKLDIPILAANMDTVCGTEMAGVMGELGGMGVLHRGMAVGQRIKAVTTLADEGLRVGVAVGIHALMKEIVEYMHMEIQHTLLTRFI